MTIHLHRYKHRAISHAEEARSQGFIAVIDKRKEGKGYKVYVYKRND